jgi:hypothetical protein
LRTAAPLQFSTDHFEQYDEQIELTPCESVFL